MSDEDKEAQSDELLALASIYEEGAFTAAKDGNGGQFSACIQLPKPFLINLDGPMTDQVKRIGGVKLVHEDGLQRLPVHYLPPIVLNFQYPHDYPSSSAPSFTLSSMWLSVNQLSQLCNKLDELWTENDNEVILFMWTQFLLEESLDHLGLSSPLTLDTTELEFARDSQDEEFEEYERTDHYEGAASRTHDPRAFQDIASVPHLIPVIVEYDQAQQQKAFNLAVYCCNVCFGEKQGMDCLLFMGCDHVHCKACMKEYFKVQIQEGNVKGLNCPETDCDSQALPSQVRELVGQELYATYDRLLLQNSLEVMEDIVYCPRTSCQFPVMAEKDSTMGVCPKCRLPFCVVCKMTYHGTAPCQLKSENLQHVLDVWRNGSEAMQLKLAKHYGRDVIEKALNDKTSAFWQKLHQNWKSGNAGVRKDLERRYGKNNIVSAFKSDLNLKWLKQNTKQCPKCKASIEIISGCNKMTCSKCCASFCWLCMADLNIDKPYSHFTTKGSSCKGKLYDV